MSSITSTELSITPEGMDNSRLAYNTNTSNIILENNSSDVTISKIDASNSFNTMSSSTNQQMKAQVVPLVYIQNTKLPFATVGKTTNNVIVNSIPQLQFASLTPGLGKTVTVTSSVGLPANPNVIFTTGRTAPIVFQKTQGNVLPVVTVSMTPATKINGTYLTMLKSIPKPTDTTLQVASNNIHQIPEISLLNNNTYIQQQSTQQKILLTSMPQLTSNRLPTTATTNCVKPKFAILPMPVPNTEPTATKKVYNFKISDGLLQGDASTVTTMCDNRSNENSMDADSNSENLVCDEVLDAESPDKNDISNKTYELSIVEESVSSQSDLRGSIIRKKPKEAPRFPTHGVSILKKNYNLDRTTEKVNNPIVSNLHPTPENNVASSKSDEDSIIITIPTKPDKERRRKSNFAYRKEFDEMEVTSTSFSPDIFSKQETVITKCPVKLESPKKNLTNEIEIELIKEKTESDAETDLQKMLKWENGIGTLPGSKVKFVVNEFNMIEYITENEFKTIYEKKMPKPQEKVKTELPEDMRCLECGCFGLPSDFINPKFCSYDCQDLFGTRVKKEKIEKVKKKKKKSKVEKTEYENPVMPKPEVKLEKEENLSEEDSNDNSSQDRFVSYPWSCKKKGFSWSKYLEHVKGKAAPVKLFKDPFPYTRNGFRAGMKLEGVDPHHPSYFCVMTVAEVVGYRIRLHFDGFADSYDFWCNADSMDIFPVGWCEKYGHVLQPPPQYTVSNFNWINYLRVTKATAAPKQLFANRSGQAICPNGFRVGMKLEAVDRKNTSLVCVASIRDMMDNRILVHFDSWDDIYDYWADPTSPYIHPVGWCDQYGHNLTPPNDYPNPELFSWEVYLKETRSVAAPVRAFKQRPACGFKRGMRLECVDKRVPQLIRVATVEDVKEHQIRIHFDGWMDKYGYWVDDDSPDIHPMGWCQKTGHPIEPPLTPDDVYDYNLGCQTIGCRGLGHVQGPKFEKHTAKEHCPYAEENIDLERKLPDRLLSPNRTPEAVEPVSREPKECKIKPRLGRPPKHLQQRKSDPIEEPPEKKSKKILPKTTDEPVPLSTVVKAKSFIEQTLRPAVEIESWDKHSRFLRKFITSDIDPTLWSYREVSHFVSKLPCCGDKTEVFLKERIDGEALLSLSQKDIITILKYNLGPAVKLYNSIVLLRQHVDRKMFAHNI